MTATRRVTVITAEWLDGLEFPAFVGETWNGWAVPHVTREVAEQIAEALAAKSAAGHDLDSWTFDGDTLVVTSWQSDSDQDRIDPDEGLYEIGLGYTWDFA